MEHADATDVVWVTSEALCVIDREQGGIEALADDGIKLLSLLTAADLRATA